MNSKKIITAAALLVACPLVLHAQAPPLTAPAAPTAPVSPTTPAASAVTLRYKFAVGQVHLYQYNAETSVLMQTGQNGAGIPMNMTMKMTMRQTVKSIRPADGAAAIVTQIEAMHMLNNGQEMLLPESVSAKMKQPFTEVMLPTGKVLSVNVPGMSGISIPGMDFSKAMMGDLGSTAVLPAGPVKVGDSWTIPGAVPGVGLDIASTSALAALSPTQATITTKQTGTLDTPGTGAMPMKMQGKISSDMTQVFDTSAGVLQSTNGTRIIDMLMTFPKSADGTMPAGMPSAMQTQTQMKYTMELLTGSSVAVPNSPAAAPAQ